MQGETMPNERVNELNRGNATTLPYCNFCGDEGVHGRMFPELDTYDWRNVFEYARPERALPGDREAGPAFRREDVVEIIALREGENDERPWLGLFRLADERYAFIEASCDYTGWDCQAGGFSVSSYHLDRLLRHGITREQALHLGIASLQQGAVDEAAGQGQG